MTNSNDLVESLMELESKQDAEMLRNGRSELYWHMEEQIARLCRKLDEVEEREGR